MPKTAFLAIVFAMTACAVGVADGSGSAKDGNATNPSSTTLPDGTGFDDARDGGRADSGKADSGGSSSSSSSGSSSGGSTSSSSSSGGSTSSSGGSSSSSSGGSTSSSGGVSGACGVCDRMWTCNGFSDYWQTEGGACVNTRTTTSLRCDGKFGQGPSYNVGTWTGDATELALVFPMLGGGTKTVYCSP